MPEEGEKDEKGSADGQEKDGSEEAAGRERLLRLAAEFDNYKKRTVKELENAKSIGKAELASKILHVIDEFGLALESIDTTTENGKGVAMVFSNLLSIMKKEGLREIDSSSVFDPYKHEIVMTRESDEGEGTILETVRKGYTINGIMLRPASVIVSKGPKKDKKQEGKKDDE